MDGLAEIDKFVGFLRTHRDERLCDECVRGLSGLDPSVDATYLATLLVQATQMTQYRRVKSFCGGCERQDFVTVFVG